jgi:hypothetical protein
VLPAHVVAFTVAVALLAMHVVVALLAISRHASISESLEPCATRTFS